ncbi:MAG: hypothetical protein JST21_03205 [Bacteroidetes bacterium]|nr:hypothetical protein [Bacteroidota bacterium]
MKRICTILLVFTGVCLFSCQKEINDYLANENNPGDSSGTGSKDSPNVLKGTWVFDSLSNQSQNSSEVSINSVDYLTISNLNYITLGNFGNLDIDDSLFNLVGCTYSATGNTFVDQYQNGVLTSSDTTQYALYLPPSTNLSDYQIISSDSVYLPHGGFLSTDSTYQPYGMHFKIDGNTLVFTKYTNTDTSIVKNDGYTYLEKTNGINNYYFHKN